MMPRSGVKIGGGGGEERRHSSFLFVFLFLFIFVILLTWRDRVSSMKTPGRPRHPLSEGRHEGAGTSRGELVQRVLGPFQRTCRESWLFPAIHKA